LKIIILYFRVLEQKKVEYQASLERTKELEKLSLLEQKKTREDKQRQTRLITLKVFAISFVIYFHILFIRKHNDENNNMKIILKSMNVVHQHQIIDLHQQDNEQILVHHHFHLHPMLMMYLVYSFFLRTIAIDSFFM